MNWEIINVFIPIWSTMATSAEGKLQNWYQQLTEKSVFPLT